MLRDDTFRSGELEGPGHDGAPAEPGVATPKSTGGMDELSSIDLVKGCQDGDQRAEEELFHRYAKRLVAKVTHELRKYSRKVTRCFEPDDILQDALKSFYVRVRDGRLVVERSGELWCLLASITLHKLSHRVEYHRAQIRNVAIECHFGAEKDLNEYTVPRLKEEPSHEDVVVLLDELDKVMRELEFSERLIIQDLLNNYTQGQTAERHECSERNVRRIWKDFRERLQARNQEYSIR